MSAKNFEERLKKHAGAFHPVVPFEKKDRLLLLDFTERNKELNAEILENTNLFIKYINSKLQEAEAKYGIGGYNEHRTIYSRSKVFDGEQPPLAPATGENNAQPLLREDSSLLEEDISFGEFYQEADPISYKVLKNFVSQHRRFPTHTEDILWEQLRGNKLDGHAFRRQHIIGNFIVDFVCLAKKLVIEVDGLIHQLPENKISDEERTLWLGMKGYTVVRFTNEAILFDLENTLNQIRQKLIQLPFSPRKTFEPSKKENQAINENVSISKVSAADSSPVGGSRMGAEPRRLHLGIDIWGRPYTKVMAPLDGIVHSFAFNNAFGDYGATIIITHNLDGETFHTLYGHLSLNSIKNIQAGERIRKGDVFTEFGIPFENGQWPPHLHFQLIIDMQGMKGDYPGVCKYSEREKYLANCPDPDLILQMMQYARE